MGVVTVPDRPVGRRAIPAPTPVAVAALRLSLPVLRPERLRSQEAVAALAALQPDVGILADYGKLVPPALLDLPAHGILNLHPSLLPRHRGATPIPAAILAGDGETGVTLFRMDPGMDTGPIVAAERVALAGNETAPELEERLAVVAAALLARSLGPWLRGELFAVDQPADGATATRPFRRADGRLDPALSARDLERRVRALAPWPGTFLETEAGRLAVLGAAVGEGSAMAAPPAGTLVPDGDGLALVAGDGRLLRLLRLQPSGGRPMDGAALRRGRPGLVRRERGPVG